MVDMLGIVFIALGRVRWTALATACDVHRRAPRDRDPDHRSAGSPTSACCRAWLAGRAQLIFAEVLIVDVPVVGLPLGRWARQHERRPRSPSCRARCGSSAIASRRSPRSSMPPSARSASTRAGGPASRSAASGSASCSGAARWARSTRPPVPTAAGAAVKLLNRARDRSAASLVERFHREMEIAARLESPHIVKVLEVSPPDAPVPYIAMERLHGTDLATRLRNEQPHAVRRARRAARSGRARARGRAARRRRPSRSQAAQPVPPRRRDLEDPRFRRRPRSWTARAR